MNPLRFVEGHTVHERPQGPRNRFRYPVFALLFRVDAEDTLAAQLRNRFFGCVRVNPADYLDGRASSFQAGVKEFLHAQCGYDATGAEIWLQTMPRMFGYAFNPVSFWFCRRDGEIDGVLCEVNNTFGERHFYWVPTQVGTQLGSDASWFEAPKEFHVSPFLPVEGSYRFRFHFGADHVRADVNYHGNDGALRLASWVEGAHAPLAETDLFQVLVRYGWLTPLVVARIHWQALRLWLKRARFFRKPEAPEIEVTK